LISVIAAFSLIGIMLGVATLIVVLSVMRGVRDEMVDSIIGLEGHIGIYSTGRGITDYDQLVRQVRAMKGVKSGVPVVRGQVMLSFRGQAVGSMTTGLRAEDLHLKPLLSQKLVEGDIADFGKTDGVYIGKRMAEKMGIHVGDAVTLISPQGRYT